MKKSADKPDRTWYFKSINGVVTYDSKHFLKSWTNPTTKKKYTSSDPILTADNNWYLPLSIMYVTEVQAPTGYQRDKTEYSMRIKAEKDVNMVNGVWRNRFCPTAEITVNNQKKTDEKWKAQIQIKKVNKNLEGLGNAVFKVYTYKDCTIPAMKDESSGEQITLTSKKNGLSNIENLEFNADEKSVTLYCKEFSAPSGYSTTNETFSVTFEKSAFDELYKKDQKTEGELKLFGPKEGIVNEEGWKVRVDAKKIDEDGNGLKGAVLGVYKTNVCDEASKIGELTSIEDGSTDTVDFSVPTAQDEVTLFCQEINAPDGYSKSNKIYSLTFYKKDYDSLSEDEKKNGELKTFGFEDDGKGIVNHEGWKVRVNAKKISIDKKTLSGAVFEVYKDGSCTSDSLVGTLTSGADGMTNELEVGLDNDTVSVVLYCKETEAPEGYKISDDAETYQLTFYKEKYDELKKAGDTKGELQTFGPEEGIPNPTATVTPTPKITNPPPSGSGLYVKKTSTAADDVMDLSSYTLAGAEFSVTSSRGFSGTLKTDESGNSNVLTLPDNHNTTWIPAVYDNEGRLISQGYTRIDPVTTTYYITETKAPHWHKKSYETKTITVTMPDDKDKLFEVDFEDEPFFCDNEFDIEKLGVKGEAIEGVVFKVEYYDADDGTDGGAGTNLVDNVSGTLKRTWYLKTDSNGHVKMDDAHLDTDNSSDVFFKDHWYESQTEAQRNH